MTTPPTATRPSRIRAAASVREQMPSLESARARGTRPRRVMGIGCLRYTGPCWPCPHLSSFRRFLHEAPLAAASLNLAGRIYDANAALLSAGGYTLDELRGRSVFDFLEQDGAADARARFSALVSGQGPMYTRGAPLSREERRRARRAADGVAGARRGRRPRRLPRAHGRRQRAQEGIREAAAKAVKLKQ